MTTVASIVALGFLLGMRHATDADHVVAVATIVSRERSMKLAAWVGALWGLGHTVTIVLVGVPIILFNWAVAPRVELAMEFMVGLMLILLGVRNLLGTQWRGTSSLGWARAEVVHAHPHTHGDYVHSHPHGHIPESHPHRPGETRSADWIGPSEVLGSIKPPGRSSSASSTDWLVPPPSRCLC